MMKKSEVGLKPLMGQSFAADVETAWRSHLAAANLQEFVLVITIVRRLQTPLKVPLAGSRCPKCFR